MSLPPAIAADPAHSRRLIGELRGLVLLHQALGIEGYPPVAGFAESSPETPAASTQSRPGTHPRAAAGPGARPVTKAASTEIASNCSAKETPSRAAATPRPDLAGLCQRIRQCRGCQLHNANTAVICGQGSTGARLLLVGDAPGPAEAAAGLPFQGPAGELLNRMLAAIGLSRQEIYLTTLVKCPQPDNRPPPAAAIRECLPWLQEEISAVGPTLICTMGQEASQALLGSRRNLLQLRGKFHDWRGIPLMPTLAPDFLLVNPEMKKAAWHDLQLIQKKL